ncbi:unnamed protein product [Bursaphelenchus xylophilus]|uniref:(pine wood nematode) hypothetical protein n=1 Tax=Bursaphelenchus xylophilus TaxID=6326 RepID=A0A7I8XN82_BURXY|nr:unnamed protein product [Bursaphelenchus xylophilus]CAG9080913.1 unnamed protein product [Bursaphelenchus xylophilus]
MLKQTIRCKRPHSNHEGSLCDPDCPRSRYRSFRGVNVDREKKEGICGACFNEEFKRLCDELEKKQKDHFPGEFAIVRGLLSCGYAKCQLTEEYCERNKATFDRLSPQKR